MRDAALLVLILVGCARPAREAEPAQGAPEAVEPAPHAEPPPGTGSAPGRPPEAEPTPPAPEAEAREEPPPETTAAPQAGPREEPLPRPVQLGKYDPPATLGHLETTPPEMRREIDELVTAMFDPYGGRESFQAQLRLAAIGKPAYLPILARMAAIRDTITDVDSMEERMSESSLMLGDQCLRQMDGYLDAMNKGLIRPGSDRKYIKYILILHYRRWCDGLRAGATPLKDLDEMPGPFDPEIAPPTKD